MKLKLKKTYALIPCVLAVAIYAGCKPEKISTGNGLTANNDASFTATALSGKPNYYVLKASEAGVLGIKWDLGAGTYNVTLTTIGIGGVSKTSAPKAITIATSDPKAGNLVVGGKMGPGDDA